MNNSFQQQSSSKSFDFKTVARAALVPFAIWALAVVFITFVGRQPGVICTTPVAWLLALWAGMTCAANSRSANKSTLLTEAALAGGVLGLLQGLLFAVIAPFMGVKPEEQQRSLVISAIIIVIGVGVSALLSAGISAAQANKRRTAQ